ncbi:CYCT1-1 [Scenedesmus sp. PABB004]|nr:CYCT1-1 [Scenedesmus sp. PABB004]
MTAAAAAGAMTAGVGSAGLPLYSAAALQDSPSARDGLEPHVEAQWRRQYTHFIIDVGRSLSVMQLTIYTAVFLCHHYFAKRSMKRNDRYLIATACLYLACKVQETPKYLRDVIKQAEIKKWQRWCAAHPTEPRRWEDISHLEAMRDQVLVAERAVLYSIAFSLRVKVPYPDLLAMQDLVPPGQRSEVVNIAWSIINDSLQTQVSLAHAPEKLAATALFLAHMMQGLPLPSRDGRGFCALANITHEELQEISDQMLDVYITVLCPDSVPATPGHAADDPRPPSPGGGRLELQENRVRLIQAGAQERDGAAAAAAKPQQGEQQQQQQQQPRREPADGSGSAAGTRAGAAAGAHSRRRAARPPRCSTAARTAHAQTCGAPPAVAARRHKPATMADNSWMFCPISGYMLEFDAVRGVAHCPQTGYTKRLEDLQHIKLMTRTNMEDYRRQYKLEPLVKEELLQKQQTRVRATVDETCPGCGNRGMEFYTMQLRSADEGQTVFYECTKCGHKYSTNT